MKATHPIALAALVVVAAVSTSATLPSKPFGSEESNTGPRRQFGPPVSKFGTVYEVAAPASNPLGGSLRYVENSGVCGKWRT
jgi:hypothetical protein